MEEEEEEEEGATMEAIGEPWGGVSDRSSSCPRRMTHSYALFPGCKLTRNRCQGPITDYGSSMVQWMRNRRPPHKGGTLLEMERPSPSYIVDVCSSNKQYTILPSCLVPL